MRERDYSLDIARGIAGVLVVVGHISSTPALIHICIYSFHMPLFYIISGMILNTKIAFKDFLLKRVKGLFFPYLALNLLVWLMENAIKFVISLLGFTSFDREKSISSLLGIFVGWRLTEYYYILWFVISLFFGELLAYVILHIVHDSKWILLIGIIFVLLSPWVWKNVSGLPYSIDTLPIAVGFILVGNSIYDYIKGTITTRNILKGGIILLFTCVVAIIGSQNWGDVDIYNCQIGQIFIFILTSLSGSIAIIYISKGIKRNRIVEFLSANTLTFYAFQNKIVIPICENAVRFIDKMFISNLLYYMEWVISAVLTILILSMISIVINKFAPYIVGKGKGKRLHEKNYCKCS